MSLYLFFVLFAYYILQPVSQAMFLTELNVDKLPRLTMLIALGGGVLAYGYSRLTVEASLRVAVNTAMALAVGCLLALWWLVSFNNDAMLYVFNIWVSLFGIVMPTQGWLVAANVFDTRTAKRVYGMVGLGAVLGAWTGGMFIAMYARRIGGRNLILVSAALVVAAYATFRCVAAQRGVSLARPAGEEQNEFAFREILAALGRYRHLQVIMGITAVIFIVDTVLDFQFKTMATRRYQGDELAAFLGKFKGVYVTMLTFPLQFLFTAGIVRRLGVGGTLQVMPAAIMAASVGIMAAPGLATTMAARLMEAAGRYTLNKTGMELLFLPLPAELRHRTKVFVDVFVDRFGRGLGGVILQVLVAAKVRDIRLISPVVMAFAFVWMLLARRAGREYLRTVRGRLATRRLELESSRVNVNDPAMIRLLEETAASDNPRQAAYALGLLAEAPHYDPAPLLGRLAKTPWDDVRAKAYEVAWFVRCRDLYARAEEEIRAAGGEEAGAALHQAVIYLLSFAKDPPAAARELMRHANPAIAASALQAMRVNPVWVQELATREWLHAAAEDPRPRRRELAAFAISIRGDEGTEAIHQLLNDPDPGVAAAACRAAGALHNRAYVEALVRLLPDPRLRGASVEALAAFGVRITGTLEDLMHDPATPPAVRRQVPRVLKLVADQRSVNVLLGLIGDPDAALRSAALKALNRLRERAPGLAYDDPLVNSQIAEEARQYFELRAALAALAERRGARGATGLLARTLEERCGQTLERLFRLLGLRYPQREIHAAYRAVRGNPDERTASALEFLESVLDRSLSKLVLPIVDAPERALDSGRELFGVEPRNAESALRELIRSGDPWLAACAMAAAAEQKLRRLLPDIRHAAEGSTAEVSAVALAAAALLTIENQPAG
jgi:ATP/ADP translocase/HEAT repeat protein